MKVVLDTNVLVAAFVAHGNCNELLEHCIVHHQVILSEFILDERLHVLTRKFDLSPLEVQDAIRLLRTRTRLVDPDPLPIPVSRDSDDDTILATARTAGCVAIVTGDRDLTDLKRYGDIWIVTPSAFWAFEHGELWKT